MVYQPHSQGVQNVLVYSELFQDRHYTHHMLTKVLDGMQADTSDLVNALLSDEPIGFPENPSPA